MAIADVAMATEAAVETVSQVAAPVVTTGTLDYKKVAIVTVSCVGVAAGTYFAIGAIKKRNARKSLENQILKAAVPIEVNPETLEPEPPKTK
jgi:hypothetical protein